MFLSSAIEMEYEKDILYRLQYILDLKEIPYGETRSYKQIAQQIGKPTVCRAVGGATNKNPIMIIVPCHRVIGSDGTLTEYAGDLELKETLLRIEHADL